MFRRVKALLSTIFERRTKAPTPEQHAFNALVGKFSQIQYLVDRKANLDVIEKAPVGICITNKKYVYEYVNPAYCEIYGYTYDELIGKPFTVVVPPEYQKELTRLHDKFMDQEAELEGEWVVVTKSGELRTILANAAYVIDEQRRPKKITFVLDITQRKAAQAALEKEQKLRRTMVEKLRSEIAPAIERAVGESESTDLADLRARIVDLLELHDER